MRFLPKTSPRTPNACRCLKTGGMNKIGRLSAVGNVEKAARAELRSLAGPVRGSALAAAVIVLAQRLDDKPGDAVASMLVRELRQAMVYLHRQAPEDDTSDVSDFLASIAEPDRRDSAH